MKIFILNTLITLYTLLYTGTCISANNNNNRQLFATRPVLRPPIGDNYVNTLPDNWFDQRVDHFNTSDIRTFKQRYFINYKYYKTGGPVFLMLDGESEASDFFITQGGVAKYAEKFNAMTVDLEHRFYGKSMPTEDLSTENLRYLSIKQALKDTEQFIDYLNKKLSLINTKWIVFGGSYAGALAALFREKYPHSVAGAVASSATVNSIYDCKQYFGVVSQSLGSECSKQISLAVHQLEDQMKSIKGWQTIGKQFNLCQPLDGTDPGSVHQMLYSLAIPFAVAAQYNGTTDLGIRQVCAVMTNYTSMTPLDRYAKVQSLFLRGQCLDCDYNKYVKRMKNTTSDVQSMARQWIYTTCSEIGDFTTTSLPGSPFGHNLTVDGFVKHCTDIYGPEFTAQSIQRAVDDHNANYGGAKPNLTNVVFPNGSLDPWSVLSVLHDLNNSTRAVFIEGTSHGSDMMAEQPTDPRVLIDARKTIEKQLSS
ncbi:putative serine protease K12H4.7 [Oppia nitens]|uniref:putative serine protease K12H4.7 n=1 Tax=Oppia nitens TaxID=1686743 RepID=UPI0023DA3142|nr:putative serine protease K12H4.7 [Oppia nitens]